MLVLVSEPCQGVKMITFGKNNAESIADPQEQVHPLSNE